MSEFTTAVEPTAKSRMRPLHHLRWHGRTRRLLTALGATVLMTACASSSTDLVSDKDMAGVTLSAVGHYGSMIGVPDYTVDGHRGGNNGGWGGGGKTSCCVLLPRKITKPIVVTVKWQTYCSNVDEERNHQATVPIHFQVEPGEGGAGLYVHFLPGHRVEVWYPIAGPLNPTYPGPEYPRGPAPRYAPLPEEMPQPEISSKNP